MYAGVVSHACRPDKHVREGCIVGLSNWINGVRDVDLNRTPPPPSPNQNLDRADRTTPPVCRRQLVQTYPGARALYRAMMA